MAIGLEHIPYFSEILALDGFLGDPVLTFGFHELQASRPGSLRRSLAVISGSMSRSV